jgi:hypothetical protein
VEVASGHLEYEQADAGALSAVFTRVQADTSMGRRHAYGLAKKWACAIQRRVEVHPFASVIIEDLPR